MNPNLKQVTWKRIENKNPGYSALDGRVGDSKNKKSSITDLDLVSINGNYHYSSSAKNKTFLRNSRYDFKYGSEKQKGERNKSYRVDSRKIWWWMTPWVAIKQKDWVTLIFIIL